MSLRDILVHVDDTPACAGRLHVARELARSHGSHLAGLYVLCLPEIPDYVAAQIPAEVLTTGAKIAREYAAQAERKFRDLADRAGVTAEWRYAEDDLVRQLNLHAHYADLVVVGRRSAGDLESKSGGLAEKLVFESGRPVLIIPDGHAPTDDIPGDIGNNVVVAWNATRESARAVSDALPLLERARQVSVVSIESSARDAEEDSSKPDICQYLDYHGIAAKLHRIERAESKAGHALLSFAADNDIDLIVMGGYGHTRLREHVLGGVTQHVQEHMTVPVLMAH